MGASTRAGAKRAPRVCTHTADKVEQVFWLGHQFAAAAAGAEKWGAHAIHWCSVCGAIGITRSDKAGRVSEVWRLPGGARPK